ncbi:MAG: hypothetical protein CSYNP_04467 [Syntrophus sp. SKADARSKE-3]|nr:hypothetical protein [Syntrophus sp. SKADARSKE-3]
MAVADAKAAGVFHKSGSGCEQIGQISVSGKVVQNLFGARRHNKTDSRVDSSSLQDFRHGDHILVGRICAAAYADLLHIDFLKLADRPDMVGTVGEGSHRDHTVKVDPDGTIVYGIRIG